MCPENPQTQIDRMKNTYRALRQIHWDGVARKLDGWKSQGEFYQRLLSQHYRFLIPPGLRVLEIGCGLGDLLAAVQPGYAAGVDFSAEMVRRAAQRHPTIHFILADAHVLPLKDKFDIIILSDLVNDLWDVQAAFEELRRLAHPRTRLILNTYSQVWEPTLKLMQSLGLSKPNLEQNWLTREDILNLLKLTGFEAIKSDQQILLPLSIPLLSALSNRWLVKIWPFSLLALTNFIIARPDPQRCSAAALPSVSVIIPARNESGNIAGLLERTPEMGSFTELVFVEGHSSDDTYATIERSIVEHPERRCNLLRQTGKGKGDAVRLGFDNAAGDILMILDADMTVPPEDLPRFYHALVERKGEFINGVRLVYPIEDQAMRFLNLLGNKFFSLAFTWLLGQPVKDTLCGTKVLWRVDYQLIAANRAYFGDFDPFGDFDLLFGAAKLGLKIVDLPIRYRSRSYGVTNIDRWKHGLLLFKMVLLAARRIKFV